MVRALRIEYEGAMRLTADCSARLATLNLHLNANYSKTLFNAYNTWAFFKRCSLANENGFGMLPDEILDNILIQAYPSFQQMYSNKNNTAFFHTMNLGREKGKREHQEVLNRSTCNVSCD